MKNSIKHICKHFYLDLLFIRNSNNSNISNFYNFFIENNFIPIDYKINYLLNYVNTITFELIILIDIYGGSSTSHPSTIKFLPIFNDIKLGPYIVWRFINNFNLVDYSIGGNELKYNDFKNFILTGVLKSDIGLVYYNNRYNSIQYFIILLYIYINLYKSKIITNKIILLSYDYDYKFNFIDLLDNELQGNSLELDMLIPIYYFFNYIKENINILEFDDLN